MLNTQRKSLDGSLASWCQFKVSRAGAELGADTNLGRQDHVCVATLCYSWGDRRRRHMSHEQGPILILPSM